MMHKGQINSGSFKKGMIPWNKIGLKKNCKTCNKEFHCRPKNFSISKYCSRKCQWENKEFKQYIKSRENFKCILCGMEEHLLKIKLHIHHIDYDKMNNNKNNCCSLCVYCHTKTNFNREYWTYFFQSLLKEKYDYSYPNQINYSVLSTNK